MQQNKGVMENSTGIEVVDKLKYSIAFFYLNKDDQYLCCKTFLQIVLKDLIGLNLIF